MYEFYLAGERLPVTPGKLQLKIKGTNKTLTLINDGEINFLRNPGLTDISFDAVLPMLQAYSFSNYPDGFKPPDYYLALLERLITDLKPCQFIITRTAPSGEPLYDTNLKVSVEDYGIVEDAKDGPDVTVKIVLKQYRDYSTKEVTVTTTADGADSVSVETKRSSGTAPAASGATHTVSGKDNLWSIAKTYLGDGSLSTLIYDLNKEVIEAAAKAHGYESSNNGWWIFDGTVLQIPAVDSVKTVTDSAGNTKAAIVKPTSSTKGLLQ